MQKNKLHIHKNIACLLEIGPFPLAALVAAT